MSQGSISGTLSGGGSASSGAPAPFPDGVIAVSLFGTFSATVQLQRSLDYGTTWVPIWDPTAQGPAEFTAPSSFDIETGALQSVQYRLYLAAYVSGTVDYQMLWAPRYIGAR